MNSYIQLLQEEPVLRRLSFIQLLTYFGAWFSNVAIYTLLIELHVSATIIAFVAMLNFLAGVIQAPFSGAVIDRFAAKKLLLFFVGVTFVTTLSLVFVSEREDLPLLYVLIFVKMAAASFYFTTEMSLLPKILKEKRLQMANELHSMIWSLSYTLGMALSGFAVYLFGIKSAFLLDSAMFVVAFFLLYRLELQEEYTRVQYNLLRMMQQSIVYLKNNPKAMHLMIVHAFVGLTAFDALVALMVEVYYSSLLATSLALGLLHAARAVGLVIGPVFLSHVVNQKRLLYIFIAQAFAIWIWAFVMEWFYLSLAASVLVGFFTTTLWSYSYTLLQKNIDEAFYGRVVAYNDMLFLTVAAGTSYGIGYLFERGFSLPNIAFFMGFGFIIAAIYYNFVLKREKIDDIYI